MADIYYREETQGVTYVYMGNDSTAVGSTTKWTTASGAICNRKRAIIVGSTFKLPANCTNLFYGVSMFMNTGLAMDKGDTSDCTIMTNMFGSSYLYDVDLSKWDLSNVTNMEKMFYNCQNLTSVKINTATPSLTTTKQMFSGTGSVPTILKNIELIGFTVNNVTNMNSMFYNCPQLESIKVVDGTDWKTGAPSNVNSDSMFVNCTKLPNWDVVSNIQRANTNWYFDGVHQGLPCIVYENCDSEGTLINEVYLNDSGTWRKQEVYL